MTRAIGTYRNSIAQTDAGSINTVHTFLLVLHFEFRIYNAIKIRHETINQGAFSWVIQTN